MFQTADSARRRKKKKRPFNWGMISKVVEGVIPQVAKSGADFLNTPGQPGDIVSELVKTVAKNPAAAEKIASEIAKTVPEIANNKKLGEEKNSDSATLKV